MCSSTTTAYAAKALGDRILAAALGAALCGLVPCVAVAQTFTGLGNLDAAASPPGSLAHGVSADGSIVVGGSYFFDGQSTQMYAFRWTEADGMVMLPVPPDALEGASATRVSDDGSVIVGTNGFTDFGFYEVRNGAIWFNANTQNPIADVFGDMYFANDVTADGSMVIGATRLPGFWPEYDQMFRWTKATGIENLGELGDGTYSSGVATSADGSIIVGFGDNYDSVTAIRWTEATGVVALTGIAEDIPSEARGITPDGNTIVGRAGNDAFQWTEAGGLDIIGQLPGASWSYALDVSADGSVIIGYSDFQTHTSAIIWTADDGIRNLQTMLETDYGLDLKGWMLWWATGISDDGGTIVGFAYNPSGELEGFVVTLPSACPWDLDGSGFVGTGDLIVLLGSWGDPYGAADLIELLGAWGPCE